MDDDRDIRIEAEASICHDHEPKHRDGRNHARQNALADGVSAQVRSYGALLHYRQRDGQLARAERDGELIGAGNGETAGNLRRTAQNWRSEEHTSELQSLMRLSYAVFCLKKKKN